VRTESSHPSKIKSVLCLVKAIRQVPRESETEGEQLFRGNLAECILQQNPGAFLFVF